MGEAVEMDSCLQDLASFEGFEMLVLALVLLVESQFPGLVVEGMELEVDRAVLMLEVVVGSNHSLEEVVVEQGGEPLVVVEQTPQAEAGWGRMLSWAVAKRRPTGM